MTGNTWGIPGPTFLWLYGGLAAVVFVGALLWRFFVTRGPSVEQRELSPTEVAYLNGGHRLAVYSSVAALRSASAVTVDADGRLAQTGRVPSSAPSSTASCGPRPVSTSPPSRHS